MRTEQVVLTGKGILPTRYMILGLRLAIGWLFIQASYTKMTADGGWTAEGYLTRSKGLFEALFHTMAGNGFVDGLVIVGELLIGIALVLGIATRFAALMGSILMVLVFLTILPPSGTWVNIQVLVFLGLNTLAAAQAGTFMGLDAWADQMEAKVPVLRYVLR